MKNQHASTDTATLVRYWNEGDGALVSWLPAIEDQLNARGYATRDRDGHRIRPITIAAACEWFALCDRDATHMEPHPILGSVPCCERCASAVTK